MLQALPWDDSLVKQIGALAVNGAHATPRAIVKLPEKCKNRGWFTEEAFEHFPQ